MANRRGHILYTWLVIGLGWWGLFHLFGALDLDYGREYLASIALGILAEWLAVPFPQGRLTGVFSIVLFSYLIYGLAGTAWIGALFTLLGQGIINRGNPLRTTLFNASQYVLAVSAGNYIFIKAGGDLSNPFGLNNFLPLLAFTAAYFALNHLLVNFYLKTSHRQFPLLAWGDPLRWDLLTYLFTIPTGVVMSLVYAKVGIVGAALLFLPVVVLQIIMRLYITVELINRELLALYRVARQLGERLNLEEILELVLKETRRVVSYRTGVIYLWSEEKNCYYAAAASGYHAEQLRKSSIHKGEGFIGWVMENREAQIIYDARLDPRVKKEAGLPQVYRSLLIIPLLAENETLGVFILGDKRPRSFTEKHLHILTIIGGQAAVAVTNAMLVRRLEIEANTDTLTGIFNHRYFLQRAAEEYQKTITFGSPLGLIMLDVDSFKTINDCFGHQTGDLVLAELARLLRDTIGENGVVARYGGEEFVVLLPGYSEKRAVAMAQGVRQAVREHYFQVDNFPGQVRVSLGVAVCPQHATDLVRLLQKADQALYQAKKMGKDRVISASQLTGYS